MSVRSSIMKGSFLIFRGQTKTSKPFKQILNLKNVFVLFDFELYLHLLILCFELLNVFSINQNNYWKAL